MKNYYNLNLNFSPLSKEYKFPTPNDTDPVQVWEIDQHASEELKAWASYTDLELFGLLMFWSRPNAITPIHTDIGRQFSPIYAINWIYGNTDYTMHWYEQLIDTKVNKFAINGQSDHPYLTYKGFSDSEVKEVERASFTGPALVRNDIPHSVTNGSQGPRWCCSIRFKPTIQTWEQAVELFKPYLQ